MSTTREAVVNALVGKTIGDMGHVGRLTAEEIADTLLASGVLADPEEKYADLLHFVKSVAGDGYLNTRGTARLVLSQVGEKPYPREKNG